jgi:hypothetical protein
MMKIQLVAVNHAYAFGREFGQRFSTNYIAGIEHFDAPVMEQFVTIPCKQLHTILHRENGLLAIETHWAVFVFVDDQFNAHLTKHIRGLLPLMTRSDLKELEELGLPPTAGPVAVLRDGSVQRIDVRNQVTS